MNLKIFDVAKWFLSKESMTHKKLQKLCYYAYSWFIYMENDDIENIENRLFEEKFQAWVHGPVNYELYLEYSGYKWNKIEKEDSNFGNLKEYNDFLENVWSTYGVYDGDQLETISHQELPWINARKGLKSFESSQNLIDDKDIYKEYSLRQ